MINKNVVTVLQTLNNITNSVIFKYPTTILNNVAGDIVVKLDMKKLDPDEFPTFGIYNLNEFLNIFKLFNDYNTNLIENVINVSDGKSSVQYLTTNINILENYNKNEAIFTSTESVPSVATFDLSKEALKGIKAASGIFKDLDDIVVTSQDGDVFVTLGSVNNFNAKSNSFSTKLEATTSKEFVIKIPSDNFNSIPLSNYVVEVKYNESRDAYRVLLKSTEISMQILLAVKK